MIHLILGIIMVLLLAYYVYLTVQDNKWYNSPEQVARREKEAYDTAHAYLKGKCCCGRNQEQV
jgi:hypothetical protein